MTPRLPWGPRGRCGPHLKYIELKSGYSDNGPAWIGYVTLSRSGQTVYFNGKALKKDKRARYSNHYDLETRERYWISGVKKRGLNRHWAGGGKTFVEASAVREFLALTGEKALNKVFFAVTEDVVPTEIERFVEMENEPSVHDIGGEEELEHDEEPEFQED